MVWSFLAVLFSGWLYVDASYRGPEWQRRLFKPVTLLLLLSLAWQAPLIHTTQYLILTGLLITLAGDALMLLPQKHLLYAIGAFFLCHLLYTIYFMSTKTPVFFWPIPLVLVLIGAFLISITWNQLEALRWPVCTYICMTLLMVWIATGNYLVHPASHSLSVSIGALLLLLNVIFWLFSHFRHRFPADSALIAACYFFGHFMIVRSLWV